MTNWLIDCIRSSSLSVSQSTMSHHSQRIALSVSFTFSLFVLFLSSAIFAAEPVGQPEVVEKMPGLIAFWKFGEEPGRTRVSQVADDRYALQEVGGELARADGGSYSGYSADFDGKHYLLLPRKEIGKLDIHGPQAQVSMFAVVRLQEMKRGVTIAGIWSEGKGANDDTGTRQYSMLLNMPTYGGPRQLTPHISSEGGVTRRADGSKFPWCCDYAASQSVVPEGEWCTLAFTYDSQFIRAYFNGKLEQRPLHAKEDRRTDPYFTQEGPAGKDRGMNPYYHGRGIFQYDPDKHRETKPGGPADFTVGARYAVGSFLGEALRGKLAGLAVFDRALTDEELQQLHDSAALDKLP